MEENKKYKCPEGCINIDRDCKDCVEGSKFVPVINIITNLRKIGAKDNPSYSITVSKTLLKDRRIDLEKKVKVVISQ